MQRSQFLGRKGKTVLERIARQTSCRAMYLCCDGPKIHAIVDNYSAHKHKAVADWLADHSRWTLHFTPTSCSWTDAVEGFFGKLARCRLRRGVFDSLEYLKTSIQNFIALHNWKAAKPFKWTARPERLIAGRQRGYQMTEIDH